MDENRAARVILQRHRHLDGVGSVRVDRHTGVGMNLRNRRHAVRVGRRTGQEAEPLSDGRELGSSRQVESPAGTGEGIRGEQLAHANRIPADQVEHKTLEVRGLGDVHRRA